MPATVVDDLPFVAANGWSPGNSNDQFAGPISDEVLEQIIRLKLDRIGARVAANHKASFDCDDKLSTQSRNVP